jgi:acetylglutamate kinase
VDGLRVTDEKSLEVAEMVLCGLVNTRLVRALQLAGVETQGLNGADRGLLRARKLDHLKGDLGRVGEIVAVRGEVLQALLAEGVTPVIAPICLGDDGAYNVNADHVAGAVARAVKAEKVIFATNVQAVLHNGQPIPTLTAGQAAEFIAAGVIREGMIPKVNTALELVASGVPQVLITTLSGVTAGEGTLVIPEPV